MQSLVKNSNITTSNLDTEVRVFCLFFLQLFSQPTLAFLYVNFILKCSFFSVNKQINIMNFYKGILLLQLILFLQGQDYWFDYV